MEIYDIDSEKVIKLNDDEERKVLTLKGFILTQLENDITVTGLWKWIDKLIAEKLVDARGKK
jgi:hypothetical protein